MVSCNQVMCKYNLNTKTDIKKWLLKNHPDKGGKIPVDEFNKVIECYQSEAFCKSGEPTAQKSLRVSKKNRKKIFTCMRKTANFGKINMYHKFDKSNFDPKKLNEDLENASPKIIQLLNNIKALDDLDQKNHGKKFKHFIFSDVKEGGYGAKVIASAFAANGFNNVIKARKIPKQQRLKLYIEVPSSSEKNFGLLCSNSIYGSTFNEKLKRELLKLFNERPSNIYGKKLRFIIFDSGFKEGIDLFDVKYVHIFEPSMTIADLKQTVGRATRTCGQKGLDFQPEIGWPLYVYNYYLTVPEIVQDTLTSSKFFTHNITKTNKNKDKKDEDILVFKNVEKLNDATMLYSEFDKAMNNLSKQLFDLGPALSVDYELTNNLHNIDDLNHAFMETDYYLMGGAKKNLLKKVNKQSKFYSIDIIKCQGKCGKKNTKDIPIGLDFMKQVYKKYNHPKVLIPKTNVREFFCNYMRNFDNKYCRQLNIEWASRYAYIPETVEKKKNKKEIKNELANLDLEIGTDDPPELDINYKIIEYNGKQEKSIKSNNMVPTTKLNFVKMRDFIKTNYNSKEFKWDKLVVENKCVPKTEEKPKQTNEIELNPTQKFITNYFCPESPYKGILLWHSVGTGKTCTGVATATSSFERAGYNIVWVTRTTLKSDVWKNIFDQICHVILLDEVKKGLVLPEKINDRKKLLSQSWLEPMSYKQFSNLLTGKNKIYDILKTRNGDTDILRKTLIIIDEAHKLYGGDLKATERPDTSVMEKLIINSYKKSGKDSCKLLVMTATPFTNSPLELFNLTNLFVTNESEKITTDKEEFKKQYMTSNNTLSENGVKNLANKLSGYISYLNREKDPTQFAQPIMINVPILMTHVAGDDVRDYVYLNKQINKLDADVERKINELKTKIKNMKAEYKTKRQLFNEYKKSGKSACDEKYPDISQQVEKTKCIEEFKSEIDILNNDLKHTMHDIKTLEDELYDLNKNKNTNNDSFTDMKNKVKSIKRSLIQEYMMYKKCAHLKYNSLKNKKEYSLKKRKVKSLSLKKHKNKLGTRKFKSF